MTNRILLKRNGVANTAPLAADLEYGELAINYTSGNLYFKNASNTVQVIASVGSGAAAGANTQIQFNDNGALGASANLTFDSASGNLTAGNLVTAGRLTTSGITAANIIASGVVDATGNVFAGNFVTGGNLIAYGNVSTGNIDATGNITATYFIGNGSQLTGLTTTPDSIINGTSNVAIPVANGNVNVSVDGTPNVVIATSSNVIAAGNVFAPVYIANVVFATKKTISTSSTIQPDVSIMSIGITTIDDGATVTLPDSSTWYILTTPSYE